MPQQTTHNIYQPSKLSEYLKPQNQLSKPKLKRTSETCKKQNRPKPFYRVQPNEVKMGFNTKTAS